MNTNMMNILWRTLLAIVSLFCVIGCNKESQTNSRPAIDACALLKNDEIAAVQDSSIGAAKSSANVNNGMRVAQCYYAAAESSKSVVLTITQPDAEHAGKRTAKNLWTDMFSEEAREQREQEREGEEGEKLAAPVKIDGVGDEAYWTGARFGGALYVLSRDKDVFIRISVGGADTEQGKIEKSKTLARKALDRL